MEPSVEHENLSLETAAESCQKSSPEVQDEKTNPKASFQPVEDLVKESTEVPSSVSPSQLEAVKANTKLNSDVLQQADQGTSQKIASSELPHQDLKETKLEIFEVKQSFPKHRKKKKFSKSFSPQKKNSKPILRVVFKRKSTRIPESASSDPSTIQQSIEIGKRKRSNTPELLETLSNSTVPGVTRKKRSRTPEKAVVASLHLSAQNQVEVDGNVPQESLKLKISTSTFNKHKSSVNPVSTFINAPLSINVKSTVSANLSSSDMGNVKRVLFKFRPQERHIVTKKQGTKMFRCDICSGVYRQKFSLKRHFLRSHVNIKYLSEADIWNCKIGHQEDSPKDNTKGSDASETKYPLDRKRFKANKNEIFLESNENRVMRGLYKCHECINVEYDLESEIKAHYSTHSDSQKRRFSCNKCDAVFLKKQILSRHLSTHSAKNLFFCTKCNMNFSTKNEYLKHASDHISENLCKYCSKSFSTTANKRRHEAIHEGSKRHSCELCCSCFSQGKDLDRHLKKEHSDVCVLCPICSKVFTSTVALKTHKNKKHGFSGIKKSLPETVTTFDKNKVDNSEKLAPSSSSVVQPLKVYTCKHCKKAFSSVYTMIKHRSQKHPFVHSKRKTHKRQVKQDGPQTPFISKRETRMMLKKQEEEFYLTLSQNIADNLLYNLEGQAAQLSLKVYNYNDLKEPSSNHSAHTHHLPWSLYNFPNDFDVDFALRYRGQVIKPKPPETPMSSHDLYLQATGLSRIDNSVDLSNNHKANSCYDSSPELSETESFQTNDSIQPNNLHLSLEEKKKLIGRDISIACVCNVCKEIFYSYDDFDKHSVNNHPNVVCTCVEIEGEKDVPPVIPDDLLRQHLSPCGVYFSYNVPPSIAESNNLKCTKCSSQFTAASDLYVHVIKCGGNKYSTPKFVRKMKQQRRIKRTMKNRIDLNTKQHPASPTSTKKTNDRNVFWKSGRLQTTIVKCDKTYFTSKPTKSLKTFAALSMKPKNPPKSTTVKYNRVDCPSCKRSFRAQDTLKAHINFCMKKTTRNKKLEVASSASTSDAFTFNSNADNDLLVPQNVAFQEPAADVALDLTSKTSKVAKDFVSDTAKKSNAEPMHSAKPAPLTYASKRSTKLSMVNSIDHQSSKVPLASDKNNSAADLSAKSNCITPSPELIGSTGSLNKDKTSSSVAQNKTSALDTAIKAINEYSKNLARGKLSPLSSLSLSVEKLTKRLNERNALTSDKDKSVPTEKDSQLAQSSKTHGNNVRKGSDLQLASKSKETTDNKTVGKTKIILLCTGKSTITGITEPIVKIQEKPGTLNAHVTSSRTVTDGVTKNATPGAAKNVFKNEQNSHSEKKNSSITTKPSHEANQSKCSDAMASTDAAASLTKVAEKVTKEQDISARTKEQAISLESMSEMISKSIKSGAVRALFQNDQQSPSKVIDEKQDSAPGAQKSENSEKLIQFPSRSSFEGQYSASVTTSVNNKSLDMKTSANESVPASNPNTPSKRSSKSRRSSSHHGRISPSLESIVNSIKQKLHSKELEPPQQCASWLEDEKFVIPSSAQKQQTVSNEPIQSQQSTSPNSDNKIESTDILTPTKETHSEEPNSLTNADKIASTDILNENLLHKTNELAGLDVPESNNGQISQDKISDALPSSDPMLNKASDSFGKGLSSEVNVCGQGSNNSNLKYDNMPVFSVVSDMQDALHSNELVSSKLIESIIDRIPKLDTMKSKVSNLLNKGDVAEPVTMPSLKNETRSSPLVSPCANKSGISPSKSKKIEVEKSVETSQLSTKESIIDSKLAENKNNDCLNKSIETVAPLSGTEKEPVSSNLEKSTLIKSNSDDSVQSKEIKNDATMLNDIVKVPDLPSVKAKLSHLSVFTNDTIETYTLPPKINNKSKVRGRKVKTVIKPSQRLSSLRGAKKEIVKPNVKNYKKKFEKKKHNVRNIDKHVINEIVLSKKKLHIIKDDLIKTKKSVDKTVTSTIVKLKEKQGIQNENQDVTSSNNLISGEKTDSSTILEVSDERKQTDQNVSLINQMTINEQTPSSGNLTNTGKKDSNDLVKESQNKLYADATEKAPKCSSTDNKVQQDDSNNQMSNVASNVAENSCIDAALNAREKRTSIDSINSVSNEEPTIGKTETSNLRLYRNKQIVHDASKTSNQLVSSEPVQFTNILSKMKEKLSLAEKKTSGAKSSSPNEQTIINTISEQTNVTPTNLSVSSDVSDDAESIIKSENERDEQGRFMCPYCILQFSYLSNFRRHITTCRARRLKKEIDPSPSTSPALLQYLPKKDEVEESMLNLLRHQSRQTQMMKEVDKSAENKVKGFQTYSCNVCHRIYLSLFKLLQHQVTHKLSISKEELLGDEHSFSEDGNENTDSDALSGICDTASVEAPLEDLSDLQAESEIVWQTEDGAVPSDQEKDSFSSQTVIGSDEQNEIEPLGTPDNIALNKSDASEQANRPSSDCDVESNLETPSDDGEVRDVPLPVEIGLPSCDTVIEDKNVPANELVKSTEELHVNLELSDVIDKSESEHPIIENTSDNFEINTNVDKDDNECESSPSTLEIQNVMAGTSKNEEVGNAVLPVKRFRSSGFKNRLKIDGFEKLLKGVDENIKRKRPRQNLKKSTKMLKKLKRNIAKRGVKRKQVILSHSKKSSLKVSYEDNVNQPIAKVPLKRGRKPKRRFKRNVHVNIELKSSDEASTKIEALHKAESTEVSLNMTIDHDCSVPDLTNTGFNVCSKSPSIIETIEAVVSLDNRVESNPKKDDPSDFLNEVTATEGLILSDRKSQMDLTVLDENVSLNDINQTAVGDNNLNLDKESKGSSVEDASLAHIEPTSTVSTASGDSVDSSSENIKVSIQKSILKLMTTSKQDSTPSTSLKSDEKSESDLKSLDKALPEVTGDASSMIVQNKGTDLSATDDVSLTVCHVCGKVFNSTANRNRHLIMKHKIRPVLDVKSPEITCSVSDSPTEKHSQVVGGCSTAIKIGKRVSCHICGKKFNSALNKRKHMLIIHQIKDLDPSDQKPESKSAILESEPSEVTLSSTIPQDKVECDVVFCPICRKEFNFAVNRNRHLIMKHKTKWMDVKDGENQEKSSITLKSVPGKIVKRRKRRRGFIRVCKKPVNAALKKKKLQ